MSKEELKVINEQEVLGKRFRVYGTLENPLFLAKDVAKWIEIKNVSQMLNRVDEDEKLVYTIYISGQNRECLFLTEDGLYETLMQSRQPIAKQFKKEVKRILKSIRLSGGYIAGEERMTEEQLMAQAVIVAQRKIDKMEHKIQLLEEEKADLLPDATMARDIMKTDGLYTLKDAADILEVGRNTMCRFLRDIKVFCKKYGVNVPYRIYMTSGHFKRKAGPGAATTLVTQKGMQYLYRMVKSEKGIEYFANNGKKAV